MVLWRHRQSVFFVALSLVSDVWMKTANQKWYLYMYWPTGESAAHFSSFPHQRWAVYGCFWPGTCRCLCTDISVTKRQQRKFFLWTFGAFSTPFLVLTLVVVFCCYFVRPPCSQEQAESTLPGGHIAAFPNFSLTMVKNSFFLFVGKYIDVNWINNSSLPKNCG